MGYQEGPDVPPLPAPPPPAPSGYQAPGGTYGGRPQRTNGFAIASLIFGIIGGVPFDLTSLRFSPDPVEAERELCG